jgi:hypothetical protein
MSNLPQPVALPAAKGSVGFVLRMKDVQPVHSPVQDVVRKVIRSGRAVSRLIKHNLH